jgi:hypothetical protein
MVPPKLQATIIIKMLEYDRSTQNQPGPIVVGVMAPKNDASSQQLQKQLTAGFEKNFTVHGRAVEVHAFSLAELATAKPKLVYLTPGSAGEISAIIAVCEKHKILSVTGVPELMRNGVAVGLFPKAAGTQIVVNLDAARAGGADFESRFLRIVKVLKVEP